MTDVALNDVTLAYEDANSKLLDVVSVAYVDAEEPVGHMSPENPSNPKKIPIIFLKKNFQKSQDDSKNVSLKIGSTSLQKFRPFFSLFLMRKPLSRGQKWFLRPYFPLIRGMFLLRSGLRFSFRALEVADPRVRP